MTIFKRVFNNRQNFPGRFRVKGTGFGKLHGFRVALPLHALILAAEVFFALLLVFMLALLFWDIVSPKLPVVETHPAVSANGSRQADVVDWTVFASFNPFYRDHKTEVVQDTVLAEARETNLDLELFGIRYSPDGDGVAIIRTPDKRQDAFREGDELFNGVTLNRILRDRVVIDRSGEMEVLTFPGQRGTGQFHAQVPDKGSPNDNQ
ncbi:type II secretion system protein N [Emcibacter sp.]|uniref:type II secretion system protein N n=1 Tax=Emcibacter sp. TaxID=1979954 RepID=UPI003A92B9E1